MLRTYQDWRNFHIAVQRGMFIDEVVRAPGGAGVMIFSDCETEPMWNLLFVDSLAEAQKHRLAIEQEFAARQRKPVWYVEDSAANILPPGWSSFGQNSWMVRSLCEINSTLPAEFTLKRVTTSAEASIFNQLYFDVFWGPSPAAEAARPIKDETLVAETTKEGFDVGHWLLWREATVVAMLTTICRDQCGSLYNVGTVPGMTRRGYASQAIRATLATLAGQGIQEIFLLTECNPALVPFYAQLGFKTVATGQFYRQKIGDD